MKQTNSAFSACAGLAVIGALVGAELTVIAGISIGLKDPAEGDRILEACFNPMARGLAHAPGRLLVCTAAPGAHIAQNLRYVR